MQHPSLRLIHPGSRTPFHLGTRTPRETQESWPGGRGVTFTLVPREVG